MLCGGVAIRVWIAFTNRGVKYDMDSLYAVAALLDSHPLHVYDSFRWAYPGGYFPVVLLCRWIANATGAPFYGVIKVPVILADAGIAAAVWWGTGQLAAGRRIRLLSAGLVALGPIFILISGYHGQLDAAGILPALVGVLVWERGGERRAVAAGLLVGLGASIKTVPLFMVLAMLPSVRSRREAVVLLGASLAVPLASLVPFLLADRHAVVTSLTANKGVPGWGGLSLFVQPGMIHDWLHGIVFTPSSATTFLLRRQNAIVGLAALAAGAVAWRRRMGVVPAAALIWVAVYVANPDWSYQYFIWGMPFFLLAGAAAGVGGLQLVLALPAAELYFHFAVGSAGWLYLPLIYIAWAGLAAAGVWLLRARTAAGTRATASG
jgi:hypothetical protein